MKADDMLNSIQPFDGFKEFSNAAKETIFSAMGAINFASQALENELMFTREEECVLFRQSKNVNSGLCVMAFPLFEVVEVRDLQATIIFMVAGYDTMVQSVNNATYVLNPMTQYIELVIPFNVDESTPEIIREIVTIYLDVAIQLRIEHLQHIDDDPELDGNISETGSAR
jgi:hypothetical protein